VIIATGPSPDIVELSGVYDTQVNLASNTCEGIEVMDNPTTVEQVDDVTFTMRHAALTFTGTLDQPGTSFSTDTQEVHVGPDTHRLAVTGVFFEGRFQAMVQADVTGSQTCTYQVSWHGVVRN
jgi:hypothetical protein